MRAAIVLTFIVLAACSSDPPPAAPGSGPAKEGQACGGKDGLACEPNLHCVMNGTMKPDEVGVCMN